MSFVASVDNGKKPWLLYQKFDIVTTPSFFKELDHISTVVCIQMSFVPSVDNDKNPWLSYQKVWHNNHAKFFKEFDHISTVLYMYSYEFCTYCRQ